MDYIDRSDPKVRPQYSFGTKAERDYVIADLKSFVARNATNLKEAQEAIDDIRAEQYIMQRGW